MTHYALRHRLLLAFGVLAITSRAARCQAPATDRIDTARVFTYVQQMPQLPSPRGASAGTYVNRKNAIYQAVKMPAEVREGQVEGNVFVYFVVGASGVVRDAKIVKSLSPATDAAVLAAVARLPRFVPGQQNGQGVSVGFTERISLWGPRHVYTQQEVAGYPQFPEPGYEGYLRDNLRVPAVVEQNKLSGRVEVSFVVGADGKVRDAQVVRPMCPSCDEEALRLVRTMPLWKPGRNQQGQAVPTQQLLQVTMPLANQEVYANKVYTYAEQMPVLPGAGANSNTAIAAAIRERMVGGSTCKGPVFVSFTVKANGIVADATIRKGRDADCDAAVLAAIARLPRFTPGKQGGQAVATSLSVAVSFPLPAGK